VPGSLSDGDEKIAGADGFELDHQTDAVAARDALGDKAAFLGNLDASGVLALGTPDDVRTATRELLEVFAGRAGFVLNAGCALPETTPEANIRAVVQAAREFQRQR